MIIRLIKWAAVLLLPKFLQASDKPANGLLHEYRLIAAELLRDCKETSSEMIGESAAVSAEMAKVEVWKWVLRNNELIRNAIIALALCLIWLGLTIGGLVVFIVGLVAGAAHMLHQNPDSWQLLLAAGALIGALPIFLLWLFALRQGAWSEILLNQVRKLRFAAKTDS